MALSANFTFDIYNPTGDRMVFKDITPPYSSNELGGYGSPNITRAQVSMVRVQYGNYVDISNVTIKKSGEVLAQYRKYLKTKGSAQVYDNKTIASGDIFIPFLNNLTVVSGDEFQDLGYYVPFTSFLPTTNSTELILNVTDIGLSNQFVTVPDYVWNLTYEVYGVASGTPFTSVEGMSYIVVSGGTAVQSGNTYRVGEVFVGDATSVTLNGGATVAPLASVTDKSFITLFNTELALYDYMASGIKCPCDREGYEVSKIYNGLSFLKYQQFTNAVSFEAASDMIQVLGTKINDLKECNC